MEVWTNAFRGKTHQNKGVGISHQAVLIGTTSLKYQRALISGDIGFWWCAELKIHYLCHIVSSCGENKENKRKNKTCQLQFIDWYFNHDQNRSTDGLQTGNLGLELNSGQVHDSANRGQCPQTLGLFRFRCVDKMLKDGSITGVALFPEWIILRKSNLPQQRKKMAP